MKTRNEQMAMRDAVARGRPNRPEVEISRTQSWASIVVRQTGLTLRELDRRCGAPGSGQWSKYLRGHSSPTAEKLAQIERIAPGTSRYYDSPFWDFLDPGSLGERNPRKLYEWLDESLGTIFLLAEPADVLFWRVPYQVHNNIKLIFSSTSAFTKPFDTVAALVALTHESVITQNFEGFAQCAITWRRLCTQIDNDPKLSEGLWSAMPEDLIFKFADRIDEIYESYELGA